MGSVREIPYTPKNSHAEFFRRWEFLGRVRGFKSQTQKRPSITATNPDEAALKIPRSGVLRLDGDFWGIPEIPDKRLLRLALNHRPFGSALFFSPAPETDGALYLGVRTRVQRRLFR